MVFYDPKSGRGESIHCPKGGKENVVYAIQLKKKESLCDLFKNYLVASFKTEWMVSYHTLIISNWDNFI